MQAKTDWYIVKNPEGSCEIIEVDSEQKPTLPHWGPFPSYQEAVPRRIGLIRAGKCQPL